MADFNAHLDDKQAIDKLVKLYTDTAQSVTSQLENMTAAKEYRRRQILAEITRELKQLGVDTGKWVDENVPKQYRIGMQQAVEQIRELDFLPLPVEALFTTINREAVAALVSDTSRSFADALTTVGRSVKNIQSAMFQAEIKARIAEGTITGETKRSIAASIREKIREQGITALKDKGGRTWTLERYSEMLAKTKLTEARNTGLTNKMLENKNDLVQISQNGSSHPACADWEGKILSITGQTAGYSTVDDATSDGLFHPNCRHTMNAVEPELAEQTYGWNPLTQEYEQGIIDN